MNARVVATRIRRLAASRWRSKKYEAIPDLPHRTWASGFDGALVEPGQRAGALTDQGARGRSASMHRVEDSSELRARASRRVRQGAEAGVDTDIARYRETCESITEGVFAIDRDWRFFST
jgi:hypothetical protein